MSTDYSTGEIVAQIIAAATQCWDGDEEQGVDLANQLINEHHAEPGVMISVALIAGYVLHAVTADDEELSAKIRHVREMVDTAVQRLEDG